MGNVCDFESFHKLDLETQAMAFGDELWRRENSAALDAMFETRNRLYEKDSVNITEYRVKDKRAILDFFMFFFSGFTASEDVRIYVENYYSENQEAINEILEPFTDGIKPAYTVALIEHYVLFCLTPQRIFQTLILYGMYLQGVDILAILKNYINEYGLSVMDGFFHCRLPEKLSLFDTSRENDERSVSLDAVERLLIWFRGTQDDWLPAFMIETVLQELWDNEKDIVSDYYCDGEFDADFDFSNEMDKMDEISVSQDELSCYMSNILKFPFVGDCRPDEETPAMAFWSLSKKNKGFKPHMNSKFVNYMYQATWMTYLISMLVMDVRQYVNCRLYTDEQPETKLVVQEVRSKGDIERIAVLEKQLEKKQDVINEFEIKKRKEIQEMENKISSLEEELLFYKEQQLCGEQLQELEQDVNENVSYEDMLDGLRDCNIVVIGGHESWITRMKSVLPMAKFGTRKVGDIPQLTNSVDAVFFKSDQLSHKMYFKVKSMCKACGVPFYYISGTAHKECVKQMYMQIYFSK